MSLAHPRERQLDRGVFPQGVDRRLGSSQGPRKWEEDPARKRRLITKKLPLPLATLAPESTAQERRAGNF